VSKVINQTIIANQNKLTSNPQLSGEDKKNAIAKEENKLKSVIDILKYLKANPDDYFNNVQMLNKQDPTRFTKKLAEFKELGFIRTGDGKHMTLTYGANDEMDDAAQDEWAKMLQDRIAQNKPSVKVQTKVQQTNVRSTPESLPDKKRPYSKPRRERAEGPATSKQLNANRHLQSITVIFAPNKTPLGTLCKVRNSIVYYYTLSHLFKPGWYITDNGRNIPLPDVSKWEKIFTSDRNKDDLMRLPANQLQTSLTTLPMGSIQTKSCVFLGFDPKDRYSLSLAAPSFKIDRRNARLYHDAITDHGSCGSVILDSAGGLIAIHAGADAGYDTAVPNFGYVVPLSKNF
jgi:hypothetical protein